MYWCRKKAISRGGGIPALVAMLSGASAEGSMHAAQSLLHMAKLPDLKVGLFLGATCLQLLLPQAVQMCLSTARNRMQLDAWDTNCIPVSRPISRTVRLVD